MEAMWLWWMIAFYDQFDISFMYFEAVTMSRDVE